MIKTMIMCLQLRKPRVVTALETKLKIIADFEVKNEQSISDVKWKLESYQLQIIFQYRW
jgi:hypothetical protein